MATDALSPHAIQDSLSRTRAEQTDQYTLWQILGIWALAALPMGLIHWLVAPLLIPRVNVEPRFLYLILITLSLVWQGVVAYIVLRHEVKRSGA